MRKEVQNKPEKVSNSQKNEKEEKNDDHSKYLLV